MHLQILQVVIKTKNKIKDQMYFTYDMNLDQLKYLQKTCVPVSISRIINNSLQQFYYILIKYFIALTV